MTFDAPVQPIPVRRGPIASVLVLLLAVAATLVWQPWSTAKDRLAPTAKPSPTAYIGPVAPPVVGYVPFVDVPYQDDFRRIWSVAGVTELPNGGISVTQVPVTPTPGSLESLGPDEVCRAASFTTAFVALLPATSMRLIGIVAPGSEIAGQTELLRVDRVALDDVEIDVVARPVEDPPRVSVRLFVQRDISYWPRGAYRFLTESDDGSPRFLYVCLVEPASLDGSR